MVTYYRDQQVAVTSESLRVEGRVYRLADLGQVWHRRGRRSWGSVAGRGAIAVAMIGPLIAAAVAILIAINIDASTNTTVALIGGGILLGLAAAPLADLLLERMDRSYARGSRRREIWAVVRGGPVLLVQTDDALRFGQIYRALQRALERTEPAAARRIRGR